MWKELVWDDKIDGIVTNLLANGSASIDSNSKLLDFTMRPHYQIPWIFFISSSGGRNCGLWQNYWKHFKFRPFFCRMHCWKVVCKPRNVWELKRFHDAMISLPWLFPEYIQPLQGKCGPDTRNYTHNAYAGFLYAVSQEHAFDLREIVLAVITEHMENEEIDGSRLSDTVSVKRGCTEMEAKCPTSSKEWIAYTAKDHLMETRLNSMFNQIYGINVQNDWHKNRIMYSWLKHAVLIGDKTAEKFAETLGYDGALAVHADTYLPQPEQPETEEKENGISKL